ncbi:GTP cyclohydrolase I [Azospirillum brasilense]|uniref:GTP cyclohydrolase I n=1 Tax=Azospirillum brasilense TaxID=192 RepID=A0A560CN09_AZOBR|nr:GTP cyclohydrolase I [Azospirillum brasilense]MBK3735543.1 GTP cyclohydrolase I [Azospirillum brasilense]TWA86254.1 GTP cyclohydrolase I [Azospirillum brasilense]
MTVQSHVLALVQEAMEARRSNEALDAPLDAAGEAAMIDAAARKVEELLDVLRIDHRNDHNTRDTPRRVAKMLVRELLKGRFTAPPELTEFRNAEEFDHLIVTGPIAVRSTCAHHLMPIYGTAFIGILPAKGGNILGLSKYDRIVDHFAARFQIQEELVKQIGNFIVEATRPRGLAVRISAVHMCKTHRGVRAGHDSRMVNSSFHGELLESRALREEFLMECATLERSAR